MTAAASSPPALLARARARVTLRAHAWVVAWLVVALFIAEVPVLLGTFFAPAGHTGLGTVWFINDFAQYESAMRQGAQRSDWLVTDPFTAEPSSPVFMFPLYVGTGKVAALLGAPALLLERLVEVAARALFVLSLWRFVRRFCDGLSSARAAFLLTLFGGGIGILVGLAGDALHQSFYTGNWSYELNAFGLLFSAPHVALAMAGTLELAGWLRRGLRATPLDLLMAACLGAAIALLQPFHLPVLLAALFLSGFLWWRTRAGASTLLVAGAATLGALPVLLPTVRTFSTDPFWSQTYTQQNILPSPSPDQLFVDMGVTLILACVGLWAFRDRPRPFGLLVWLLFCLAAMYVPVPYQRRLGFGLQPALAVLAADTLTWFCLRVSDRRQVTAVRLGVTVLASLSTIVVTFSILLSVRTNSPLAVYRSTPDVDQAAFWLNDNAHAGDVIAADWDLGNYLAARTPARVVGGHPVATLNPGEKAFSLRVLFAHADTLAMAHVLGATWLVYGPAEAGTPRPSEAPAFVSGDVVVYRVSPSA